jgi:hypothetical protein
MYQALRMKLDIPVFPLISPLPRVAQSSIA